MPWYAWLGLAIVGFVVFVIFMEGSHDNNNDDLYNRD